MSAFRVCVPILIFQLIWDVVQVMCCNDGRMQFYMQDIQHHQSSRRVQDQSRPGQRFKMYFCVSSSDDECSPLGQHLQVTLTEGFIVNRSDFSAYNMIQIELRFNYTLTEGLVPLKEHLPTYGAITFARLCTPKNLCNFCP